MVAEVTVGMKKMCLKTGKKFSAGNLWDFRFSYGWSWRFKSQT